MLTPRSHRPTLMAGLALAVGLLGAGEAQAGWEKAQASLVRPAAGVDADAKGSLEIRIKDGDSRESFRIKARRVDALLTHDLYLETAVGSGLFDFVASLVPDVNDLDMDELNYFLDTKDGDLLPGGSATTADLVGRMIEIRVGLDVVLHAPVPDYGESAKLKARQDLVLPLVPVDADIEGEIRLRDKQKQDDQRFEVKLQQVPVGPVSFHMFMDDGLGVMTELGAFVPDQSDPDEAWFRVRTKDGQALPFGVWSLGDLEGRAVEVRDELGAVYLEGSVPALE